MLPFQIPAYLNYLLEFISCRSYKFIKMNINKDYVYKFYFIYKTTNLINNKFYVGQHRTDNVNDDYLGSGVILNKSIKKHKRENFKREILEFCNEENINEREEFWIDELMAIEIGYNLTNKTYPSCFKKGNIPWNKGLPKEQQPNYGRIVSEETKERLRTTKRNNPYKHSLERRAKISKIRKGLKLNLSEEQIQKLRERGKFIPNEQTRNLMSINNGRYWLGKETKNAKVVYKIDSQSGEVLNSYSSVSKALKENKGAIRRCVLELKGTANGFVWVYENNLKDIKDIILRNNQQKEKIISPKEKFIKIKINRTKLKINKAKKEKELDLDRVIVVRNKRIFISINEANKITTINKTLIRKYCKNNIDGWNFMTRNEYIEKFGKTYLR